MYTRLYKGRSPFKKYKAKMYPKIFTDCNLVHVLFYS